MFNDIPLEKLQHTHDRIVAELAAGVADESIRSQYERVSVVLDARIAELGGAAVAAAAHKTPGAKQTAAPCTPSRGTNRGLRRPVGGRSNIRVRDHR